jgi:hypothetical protein
LTSTTRRHPGVVDDDVEAAEARQRPGDHGGDQLLVGDIDGQRQCAAARTSDQLSGCGHRRQLQIGADDIRAGLRQRQAQDDAEAGAGAGHDRGLTGEIEQTRHGGWLDRRRVVMLLSDRDRFAVARTWNHLHR